MKPEHEIQATPVLIAEPSSFDLLVGQEIGCSPWLEIDQERIEAFARATGDFQWIHVDVERAAREAPQGRTIAHGYLLLSLLPFLFGAIFQVVTKSRSINYGSNRVRFMRPVAVGERVRLRTAVASVEPVSGGRRVTFAQTIEVDGASKAAMAAETISVIYS